MQLHFIVSNRRLAQDAYPEIMTRYKHSPIEEAEALVVLGGDGTMLKAIHQVLEKPECKGKKIFGLTRGSVGFLLNRYSVEGLEERIKNACSEIISPLRMKAIDIHGNEHKALAVNEVSLLRQTHQAAKISISIDGEMRMKELISDGVLVATPAGSTAYNFSANGMILPLESNLLTLTAMNAFRPRRWGGALLSNDSHVTFEVVQSKLRPVNLASDMLDIASVKTVEIKMDRDLKAEVLFDPDHSWNERILQEQFRRY